MFPAWRLLAIDTLQSADDFAHLLADETRLRDALARDWMASFLAETELPPLSDEALRSLYALDCGELERRELFHHAARLIGARAWPHVLALFERWADRIRHAGSDVQWMLPHRSDHTYPFATVRDLGEIDVATGRLISTDANAPWPSYPLALPPGRYAVRVLASGMDIAAVRLAPA